MTEPETMSGQNSYTVIFAPVTASREEYENLFKDHRCGGFTKFVIHPQCGLLRFQSSAEADLCVHQFQGYIFKGQPIKCELARVLGRPGEKTIKFTGFQENDFTERELYEVMRKFGFLRRVCIQGRCAYVDFDTIQETDSFLASHTSLRVGNANLTVEKVTKQDVEDSLNFDIPLRSVLPLEHPFWLQLQEMIADGVFR